MGQPLLRRWVENHEPPPLGRTLPKSIPYRCEERGLSRRAFQPALAREREDANPGYEVIRHRVGQLVVGRKCDSRVWRSGRRNVSRDGVFAIKAGEGPRRWRTAEIELIEVPHWVFVIRAKDGFEEFPGFIGYP